MVEANEYFQIKSVRINEATWAAHDWHCATYFEFRAHSGNQLLQIRSCSPHTRDQHLTHPMPLVEWHFLWAWNPADNQTVPFVGTEVTDHYQVIIENGHSGRREDEGSGPR